MRLPENKPRLRLHGDRDKAMALKGIGHNLLLRVHQIADAAGVPVYALWARLDDGSAVRAAKIGGINVIDCYATDKEGKPTYQREQLERRRVLLSRLLWVPQGIVCTPRSRTEAPDGWGIPDATPGGALPQVLINKYPHNNYPDVIFRLLNAVNDDDAMSGVKTVMEWITAPGLYMDYESDLRVKELGEDSPNWLPVTGGEQPIGIYDSRINLDDGAWPEEWQVFTDPLLPLEVAERARLGFYRTIPLITEPESAEWHVHRAQPVELMRLSDLDGMEPEEIEAMMADLDRCIVVNDVIADIMDGVNSIREGAGKARIPDMPLRGAYSVLADCIITEATGIGVAPAPHESDQYRDGYRGFPERVRRAMKDRAAENIAMVQADSVPEGMSIGSVAVEAWNESPIHLDNILHAWPTDDDPDQSYASAPVAFGTGPADIGGETVSFTYIAQLFDRTDAWLWPKVAHHAGDFGVVGWSSENTTNRYHCSTIPNSGVLPGSYAGPWLLLLAGRVQIPRYRDRDALILGAALCGMVENDGQLYESVRVAVLSADDFSGDHDVTVSVETWALQDLARDQADPIAESTLTLPAGSRVSRFNFSRDGSKGAASVFSQTGPYTGRSMSVYRTMLAEQVNDYTKVNPGTSVRIARFAGGSIQLSQEHTLLVTPTVQCSDRARTSADTGHFPSGNTIRYSRYRAECQGEYLLYVDYDDAGNEIEGRVYVDVVTDLAGSFAMDSDTDNIPLVSVQGTGRRFDDGEFDYSFMINLPGGQVDEIKIPDSRNYPAPADAIYNHREYMELRVNGSAIVLTDYTNTEHWGVGSGVTRLISHLDMRDLSKALLYKSEFSNGQCREVWEFGGSEIGEPVENSYQHPDNFLGEPRFIPPVVAGGVIRQGVGRVFVIPGEDHFVNHPEYPDDLINEKYFSDFRVAVNFTPVDGDGNEMGVPADPFYAVLSPDINEGGAYQSIAGPGPSAHPYEQSWRLAPRCLVARKVAQPSYPIIDPVELVRREKMEAFRGQVVEHDGETMIAVKASVITGCPYVERTNEAYWQATIPDMDEKLGVDQFDDIGDIGIA